MKAKNVEEMKAVVAYMRYGEEAWQYADMNIENPDEDIIESAIYFALEKAGIKIDDKEAFQKQVAYYYEDGQYEIDDDILDGVPLPDIEDIFKELNIF